MAEVGVRDERGGESQDAEAGDFEVGVFWGEVVFCERDEGLFFFSRVKVFDDALVDEFFPAHGVVFYFLDDVWGEGAFAVGDDDEGSSESSSGELDVEFV